MNKALMVAALSLLATIATICSGFTDSWDFFGRFFGRRPIDASSPVSSRIESNEHSSRLTSGNINPITQPKQPPLKVEIERAENKSRGPLGINKSQSQERQEVKVGSKALAPAKIHPMVSREELRALRSQETSNAKLKRDEFVRNAKTRYDERWTEIDAEYRQGYDDADRRYDVDRSKAELEYDAMRADPLLGTDGERYAKARLHRSKQTGLAKATRDASWHKLKIVRQRKRDACQTKKDRECLGYQSACDIAIARINAKYDRLETELRSH